MICKKCNESKGYYLDFDKHDDYCNLCIQLYGYPSLLLYDSYIKNLLVKKEIYVTPDIIELKRQQIKLKRLIKKLCNYEKK